MTPLPLTIGIIGDGFMQPRLFEAARTRVDLHRFGPHGAIVVLSTDVGDTPEGPPMR